MFVLLFKNGNNDPTRGPFNRYCMALIEIKDFNALIDNKPFFYRQVKNKLETYEKHFEMSRNDDYTTGNLLDYLFNQKNYKLIGIDLSRKASATIPQQINFVEKLEEYGVVTMFFCL